MKLEMKTRINIPEKVVSHIAYMKKRMERRIRILNMRIRADTIVRSSMDLVTSLVIWNSL